MGRGNSKAEGGGRGGSTVHKFPDKHSGTHEYEDDYGATEAFFKQHSNSDELISSMDDEEIQAFERWTEGYFMSGQQYRGWDSMSDREKQFTEIYDKYLDQAVLNEGVEVVRLSTAELILGSGHRRVSDISEVESMKGRIITSKGSMSAGAAAEGLTIGDSSKNVEYHIQIPKGTKGAGMWVGDSRINYWGSRQREFMVNRDTAFKVGDVYHDTARHKYVVTLKYMGLQEHDYGVSGKK